MGDDLTLAGAGPAVRSPASPTGWRSRLLWGAAIYALAFLLTLGATTLIIVTLGHKPLSAYRTALRDSLGSVDGMGQTLNRMTPLLFASLAFGLGSRAGVFNIGMDGQIYAGAILATGAGFAMSGLGIGSPVALPLFLLAGVAGGALWVAAPAALRSRWGVNEIFTTVMLNFVALRLVEYLATGPWNDPMAGEAITHPIPRSALLPMLVPRGGAHVGVLVACAVAGLVWWVLFRTVPGYEVRAVGANARASRLGGVSVAAVQAGALLAGGAISGLAGAIEVAGVHERLILGLTPNYGIMGILTAVLARHHPLALVPVTFLFAALVAGSDSLQRTVGFPAAAVFMLQALVVLVVLGAEAARARRERFVV